MKQLLLAVLVLLPLAAPAAEPATPAAVVERFHAVLLEHMHQGAALDCKARAQRLEPVVAATFDPPFLARFILRKRWPQLDDAQRQRFTDVLGDLIVSSYAANFRQFGGEAFVTLGVDEPGATQRVVHTRLTRPAADPVTFDYVMRQSDGHWRVFNVIAEGVSDLAIRSAQYEKLFAEQGFDALVKWIGDQARKDGC